jgi:hypothetical protein
MDFECPVRNALLKRELAGLRGAVCRVKYLA